MDIYEQIKAISRPTPRRENPDPSAADAQQAEPSRQSKPVVPARLEGLLMTGRELKNQRGKVVEQRRQVSDSLGGEEIETEAGPCLRRDTVVPLAELRPDPALRSPGEIDWGAVCRLVRAEVDEPPCWERIAFVDTETTGLAGGTGTFAFLIGLGYFEDDGFRVEQYFMRDYCEEPAQLHAVCQSLRQREIDTVISYNGKAFDLPLIASRMIQNRLPNPLGDVVHLDLLHTARRLWKARIGDCSLGNVEEQVLGLRRHGDVPGFLIPRIYFDYVRGFAMERMVPVFEHNVTDIVSLGSLVIYLSRWDAAYMDTRYEQLDRYSLGRTYETGDAPDRATRIYERLLAEGFDGSGEEAVMRLAIIYKRLGELERAEALWKEAIAASPGFNPIPYIELAKYYEHKRKDFDAAARIVEEALTYFELETWYEYDSYEYQDASSPDQGSAADALRYRLARIQRKRERAQSKRTAGNRGEGRWD